MNIDPYRHALLSIGRAYRLAVFRVHSGLIAVVVCATLVSACGGGSNIPTPGSYALGGNISNLTATGLVLSDGTDTVAVPANATSVTFPTPLSSGAAYSVNIVSQPPGFTDICTLSNAAGTVGYVSILPITVSCHTALAVVTTLAGSSSGDTNGTGTAASFSTPEGVAVDTSGNVYVADLEDSLVRKITPAGLVTTRAGSPYGTGIFIAPFGVAIDVSGNLYVSDVGTNQVNKITPTGALTTLAGNVLINYANTAAGADIAFPSGVAVDALGNVYVADTDNRVIRKITSTGVFTTFAGGFSLPDGVAVDATGNVYVTDTGNQLISKITPTGVVTTLAGAPGVRGNANGAGTAASFNLGSIGSAGLSGIAVDSSDNLYIADAGNQVIRKITAAGVVTTLAGSGSIGSANGIGTAASFNNPAGVAVDAAGNIYVADSYNNLIRKISPQ